MQGVAQFGIALGALGIVLAMMGLFPGVTGRDPAEGVGPVQFVVLLIGMTLLHIGALIYVKFTFYGGRSSNLAQQIGVRLTWTGLLFTTISGMADFLGFGSQVTAARVEPVFGPIQATGVIGGLLLAALGVLIYAVTGGPPPPDQPPASAKED